MAIEAARTETPTGAARTSTTKLATPSMPTMVDWSAPLAAA